MFLECRQEFCRLFLPKFTENSWWFSHRVAGCAIAFVRKCYNTISQYIGWCKFFVIFNTETALELKATVESAMSGSSDLWSLIFDQSELSNLWYLRSFRDLRFKFWPLRFSVSFATFKPICLFNLKDVSFGVSQRESENDWKCRYFALELL